MRDGFPERHADLFPGSVGFGWYAWKPYLIHRTLLAANTGDLVVYQDVGRREPLLIGRPLAHWHDVLDRHGSHCIAGVSIPEFGPNRLWTKASVFRHLGLQDSRYKDEPQIQASWSVWRKCPASLSFVAEWAHLCANRSLVGGELENGLAGETGGFREHRWDQSILTLLAMRDSLPALTAGHLRGPRLDAKSIDSFSPQHRPEKGFWILHLVSRFYGTSERLLRRSGVHHGVRVSGKIPQ